MGSVIQEEIMVTIQCLAYNHEEYIRQTLDSFVMQKTNFRFEVIVHDDASTDSTPSIIAEYASKYDFIVPILQDENQCSKHISIQKNYIIPIARGKYITYCEGDDYWTDPKKLQKMVEWMENHPECSLVCHAYDLINEKDTRVLKTVRTLNHDGLISPECAIKYDNPPQLASQMFILENVRKMPDSFRGYGVDDYPALLYAITCGQIYYIDEVMSNKREASHGSWTERVYHDPRQQLNHWSQMIRLLRMYNEYTEYAYIEPINQKISDIQFNEYLLTSNYRAARKHCLFRTLTHKRKIQIIIGCFSPDLADWISSHYIG